MEDIVTRIDYYYTEVSSPRGSAKALNALKAARVDLLVCKVFPTTPGRCQINFIPANRLAFHIAARMANIDLVGPKVCFLIRGKDRTGTVADIVTKLAEAHISVTAMDAITAGQSQYAAILWVKHRKVEAAAKVLGASWSD